MSDNSNSSNSSSSNHSWTVLSPEEPAVENVGPGDDGTVIPTATPPAPGDELTGGVSEKEAVHAEEVARRGHSEEGLQVCQETATESSPSPAPDANVVILPAPITQEGEGLLEEVDGPGLAKKVADIGKQAVRLVAPLVRGVTLAELRSWGRRLIGRGESDELDSESGGEMGVVGGGLRRRKPTPGHAAEEEEEEEERRKGGEEEGWGGLSLNKCILGALVLLGLGSILFSGLEEEEVELRDVNLHRQDWSGSGPDFDPQSVQSTAALLDKLAQENQQIALLQAQLQEQKEELALALQRVEEKERAGGEGGADGERELAEENERLRTELASLPGLQGELESLRTRVSELTHITAAVSPPAHEDSTAAPPTAQLGESGDTNHTPTQPPGEMGEGGAKEGEGGEGETLRQELQRQRLLLDESRRRLEGLMGGTREERGGKRGVKEGLVDLERRLTAEIERLGGGGAREGGRKRPWGKERKRGEEEGPGGEKRRRGPEGEAREGGEGWKEKEKWKRGGRDGKQEERWRKEGERERGKPEWREERKEGEGERGKPEWREERKEGQKERGREREGGRHWRGPGFSSASPPSPGKPGHRHHDHNAFWKRQGDRMHHYRPLQGCDGTAACARREGLRPVEEPAFEALLGGYLQRLGGSAGPAEEELRRLSGDFFQDGVFLHHKMSFRDFAEDLGEILEELAEGGGEGGRELEEEMEGFQREALRRFALPGREGERRRDTRRKSEHTHRDPAEQQDGRQEGGPWRRDTHSSQA
ncbi:pre-B-cell leukemia transcription factor-interacting protein 1 isoform X2 [Amia ocellicauda]|uniref:pre-B-cell leukemia transcription factor-interacting protein 1 isoform X2 n=1 Tax=Amia ocellicauda TaxID=2972642 RepID=UPI0034644179